MAGIGDRYNTLAQNGDNKAALKMLSASAVILVLTAPAV